MAAIEKTREWLEARAKVSPKNVGACKHCQAKVEQLRRVSCWEWRVGRGSHAPYEGGYIAGCLVCGQETRIEWAGLKTPHRPSFLDELVQNG